MGALSGKTVLLVTHQIDFLPTFDNVLVSTSIMFYPLCSLKQFTLTLDILLAVNVRRENPKSRQV